MGINFHNLLLNMNKSMMVNGMELSANLCTLCNFQGQRLEVERKVSIRNR